LDLALGYRAAGRRVLTRSDVYEEREPTNGRDDNERCPRSPAGDALDAGSVITFGEIF